MDGGGSGRGHYLGVRLGRVSLVIVTGKGGSYDHLLYSLPESC